VPSGGTYELTWTGGPAGSTYALEEAEDAAFATTSVIYVGDVPAFTLYGRVDGGTWFYRVRTLAPTISPYSTTLVVTTGVREDYVLDDPSVYAPADLLAVHRATLRMCAARGDLFAVLGMPAHYGPGAAAGHAAALRDGAAGATGPTDPASGFGALYHPWLYISDAADPRSVRLTPPDGPAAGVVAATARGTGAWAAPANVALRDVVAVAEGVAAGAEAVFASAQVNLARQTPRGFVWLSADTLSEDPDRRPVGVRRLLAALRRIAALEGAAFAFEPNGAVLHRALERTFEGILAAMLARGAFAGATAADSYRVGVASPPNTAAAADAGQLIVELRVAPSRPLVFVTIRVLRTDTGAVEVRTD
jgi:hypothetical protein